MAGSTPLPANPALQRENNALSLSLPKRKVPERLCT